MEPVPFLGNFYSNVSRGIRQKENEDTLIPCVLEPDENKKPSRNWARLIQKIYEVDPLTCPQCQGIMRVISIIEDQAVIDKILGHLGLCQKNQRPPAQTQIPRTPDRLLRFPPSLL